MRMHQDLLVADILKLLISSTVTLTVLLAASIFQTIIVIVVFKILEKYLFKKFSFRNEFLEILCKYARPEGRNAEKLKYGAVSMLQGQVFWKEGGWNFSYLIFFRLYHFYIYKLLYPLQNCVVHLKKNYFFLPPQFYEKSSS